MLIQLYVSSCCYHLFFTEYKETYGDCVVPQRYQSDPQLGTWVHTQRRQYKLMKEGKKSSMTEDKIRDLDAMGFEWEAAQAWRPRTRRAVDMPHNYTAHQQQK